MIELHSMSAAVSLLDAWIESAAEWQRRALRAERRADEAELAAELARYAAEQWRADAEVLQEMAQQEAVAEAVAVPQ